MQIQKFIKNTTAQEILADFPEGFDFVITGVELAVILRRNRSSERKIPESEKVMR